MVIAANRDEYFDRTAEGPALRDLAGHAVVSPLDARAGGTWLGVNASGVFAAVTNRRTDRPDPQARSRGLLVFDALQNDSAEGAARSLETESFSGSGYNPFNLFVADLETAFAFTLGQGEDTPKGRQLAPGAHVIGNVAFSGEESPKLDALTDRVRKAADGDASAVLDELAGLCSSHEGPSESPLDDVCVHTEGYGTRSSTLLRVARGSDGRVDWRGSELRYAESAPCDGRYEDFTALLHALDRRAPVAEAGFTRSEH